MDLPKFSPKSSEEEESRTGKSQKPEPVKKGTTPKAGRPKKVDGAKKVSRKPEESRFDWWHRFRQYLRDVAYELRKVIWPSRKETIGSTAVVLVIVILSGIFLGIADLILSRFVRLLIG